MSFLFELNNEQLTKRQVMLRAKMVRELAEYIKVNRDTFCCGKAPDWASRIHVMRYHQLYNRYVSTFGRNPDE